ncbi:MAG: 26S proteasome non-ATPase regulatory subunit [Chrysothrix sp. TS-e1954]|nr:MAG: 26S proteasome non-ATPase regulatory subunit [Chrysothrix sp. TS-e1954]
MAQDDEMQVDEPVQQLNGSHDVKDDILANLEVLQQAVQQFDVRFVLRALRAISSVRKRLVTEGKALETLRAVRDARLAPSNDQSKQHTTSKKLRSEQGAMLPEEEIYLSVLEQVVYLDTKQYESGAKFSLQLVDKIRSFNRRTLDPLAARVYFYLQLFVEQLTPQPPSQQSPVLEIRERFLTALRSAVLRKDQETQAAVMVLLLRNYISTADITQADLLVAHNQFPQSASNNQVARYLYYLGRIRAIQLSYSEAHQHLTSATRKAPSSGSAAGFYQASMKLLVVVELLMGDIPDRAVFRQPRLEKALAPYFELVQAVRGGDLAGFSKVVSANADTFRKDGTFTLARRLRQNVIRTGVRMLSLAYSRISLRDLCIRLSIGSEQSAEYIVAKAIRDGVIEATINHEKGYMETKRAGDVYATREPAEAFHERIEACLGLHDECVKAMRFPMNQHKLELKNAQEARERERELAKEIQEGEMDEDDAGGEFDGL